MIDSITERTTVLTPHSRLSRWLTLQYANHQKHLGRLIWTTPKILPFHSWLQNLWVQSWPRHFILSSLQSRHIWEDIIRSDSSLSNLNLLHLKGTASQASRAFALKNEYAIATDPDSFKGTAEFEAFYRWLCEYEQRLVQLKALDASQIADYVRSAMVEGKIPLPEHLIIAGFDEITPQLNRLLQWIADQDIQVQFWPEQIDFSRARAQRNFEIRPYANQTEESVQCARWVRHLFATRPKSTGDTVGIVIPDLPDYADILRRELTAELTPKAIYPWEEVEPRFNLVTGSPLALEPMINIALILISIQSDVVPFATLSSILKSPFIFGDESESQARLSLELKLRTNNSVLVHLLSLRNQADNPRLIQLIDSLRKQHDSHMLPSEWAHEIQRLLKQNGWPGGDKNNLSSAQNQVFESWRECLDALASLDKIIGEIPRSHAVDTLVRLTHEKQFCINTGEHPIQVVSLSEAYGMRFDNLWIMGCHSDSLPALPSPNPFIPLHLQKKYNLPHATALRESHYAENVLGQLIANTSNIIVSFPEQNDKSELRISPLLKNFSNSLKRDCMINISHRTRDQLLSPLERWEDPRFIPATKDEDPLHKGGYQILKNQSDCPFRAFAKHRLHATEFNTPEIDHDSLERGNLVHTILHNFWSEVRTRDNLKKLIDDDQLTVRLRSIIHKSTESVHPNIQNQNNFMEMERHRLRSLLLEWLHMESLRPDFTVSAMEESQHIRIGEMELKVRIDRIDTLGQDKVFLIDYKTGKSQRGNWFEDRLQEIQLPLYAIKVKPDAVGFAEVKKDSNSNKFKILARNDSVMPGYKLITWEEHSKDWDSLLDLWKTQLTELAVEFTSGRMDIAPYKEPDTCAYCDLQTLCRIGGKNSLAEPEEEP